MASFVYNNAKEQFALGNIDWDTHDIRILLMNSTTTCDTEDDAAFLSSFTTLGIITGVSGYTATSAATGTALTGEAVSEDSAGNRAELDASDVAFGALGTGDTIVGALIYRLVTNNADSVPIAWIELTSTPTNGGTVTIQWNAEGIIQFTGTGNP